MEQCSILDFVSTRTTNLMAKKTIDTETQGRKNKVLKMPIDLKGITQVQILEKCPMDKGPPSLRGSPWPYSWIEH